MTGCHLTGDQRVVESRAEKLRDNRLFKNHSSAVYGSDCSGMQCIVCVECTPTFLTTVHNRSG